MTNVIDMFKHKKKEPEVLESVQVISGLLITQWSRSSHSDFLDSRLASIIMLKTINILTSDSNLVDEIEVMAILSSVEPNSAIIRAFMQAVEEIIKT